MLFSVDVIVRLVVLLVTLLSWQDFTNLAYNFMTYTCSLCLLTKNINSWHIWNTVGESWHIITQKCHPSHANSQQQVHNITAQLGFTTLKPTRTARYMGVLFSDQMKFTAHISMVIWSCFIAHMFSPILYSLCEWGEVASQNLYSVVEQVSNLYPTESDHPNIQETVEGTPVIT